MAKQVVKQAGRKLQSQVTTSKPQIKTGKPMKTIKAPRGAAKATPSGQKDNVARPAKRSAAKLPVQSVKRAATKLSAEPLTHRLDALLHTMRTISQHEDELCTLLHDARRTGKVSTTVLRELQAVLAALPAQEYTDDLEAVLQITTTA